MILIGNKVNRLLNTIRQIISTDIAAIHCDRFDVAPLFILREVLTKTPVTGSPPIIHDQIFASAFPKISLSFEKFSLVIFSAAFPEMIVSKIVIIAIISDVFISSINN